MKPNKRVWLNLFMAPLWFLVLIILLSIYYSGSGVNESEIPERITGQTPTILLSVQLLILMTLLFTNRKGKFNILKNGWTSKTGMSFDIAGGIVSGSLLAILYLMALSPLQNYLQANIGDYVPPGETMKTLGSQTIQFFIANILLAPFIEESLYRNYALTSLSEKHGSIIAICLSSIMFGLLHWPGGIWYILLTGIVVGLPFAAIATWRKNIIWVFTAHLSLNVIEYFYIYKFH